MGKKKAPEPEEKKKPRGHGWRTVMKPTKQVELTEEELALQQEERQAEQRRRSGPIRSVKKPMGVKAPHLCVRLHQQTLDWLAAEAQIKSTTVSQIVRSWIETKERESHMSTLAILGRSGGDA